MSAAPAVTDAAAISSLRQRLEELEAENQRLRSRIANCKCSQIVQGGGIFSCENVIRETGDVGTATTNQEMDGFCASSELSNKVANEVETPDTGPKAAAMCFTPKRYIALKIMYFGQRYYGFASEAQKEPTVESEIFKALSRTKLLVGTRKDSCYSRCGRTDKGVSATGQVISLYVRSNVKKTGEYSKGRDPVNEKCEIDYAKVLNRVLPSDIRVLGWCPVPDDFHSRFSCLSREYRYLFWKADLDIEVMQKAALKLIGEYDFRNFCKMDAANVSNYRRNITHVSIYPYNIRSNSDEMWAITIEGSAFLWHQVRCIVAVLFLIGQGLEPPNIVDELLDIVRVPRKPQYNMAHELPLILRSCNFHNVEFMCSADAHRALKDHLKKEYCNFMLQAAIFQEALAGLSSSSEDDTGPRGKERCHIPLMRRQTEPSYEERRVKLEKTVSLNLKTDPSELSCC